MAATRWIFAILVFGALAACLDVFYLMQNYFPHSASGGRWSPSGTSNWELAYFADQEGSPLVYVVPALWIVSFLRFVFGIPLILIASANGVIAYGAGGISTAAASATVMYTFLLPYLVVMSFFIADDGGVPIGYRVFRSFISQSGAKHVYKGIRTGQFDSEAFARANSKERTDKFQSRLETEDLEKAKEAAAEATTSARHDNDSR